MRLIQLLPPANRPYISFACSMIEQEYSQFSVLIFRRIFKESIEFHVKHIFRNTGVIEIQIIQALCSLDSTGWPQTNISIYLRMYSHIGRVLTLFANDYILSSINKIVFHISLVFSADL